MDDIEFYTLIHKTNIWEGCVGVYRHIFHYNCNLSRKMLPLERRVCGFVNQYS